MRAADDLGYPTLLAQYLHYRDLYIPTRFKRQVRRR
jgi:hypothetical protein